MDGWLRRSSQAEPHGPDEAEVATETPGTDDAAGTGPDEAQAKEPAAVEELYTSCREPALKEAQRCGLSQDQAEDVVSEVFAKLCERVRAGEGISKRQLSCGYIVRAVQKQARDVARIGRTRQGRLAERPDAVRELQGGEAVRPSAPEDALDTAVRRLKEPYRTAAVCLGQGWPCATIAGMLGVDPRTVRRWRTDIDARLRDHRSKPPSL